MANDYFQYNTKHKQCDQLLGQFGYEWVWKKMLADLAAPGAEENFGAKYITENIKELDTNVSGRRKKVLPILVRLLSDTTDSTNTKAGNVDICIDLLYGTARGMLHTVKKVYGPLMTLPPRAMQDNVRDNLRIQFMEEWDLQNLPFGLRVDLSKAIKKVIFKELKG